MSIYKYLLELKTSQEIELPGVNKILSVQVQHDRICMWVSVDTSGQNIKKTLFIVGTGDSIPQGCSYLATVQMGSYVWHIFEGEEE